MIGRHLFYRWPGAAGRHGTFAITYAGREPEIDHLLLLRLAARGPSDAARLEGAEAVASDPLPGVRRAPEDGGFLDPAKGWRPSSFGPAAAQSPAPGASASPALPRSPSAETSGSPAR